MSETNDVTPLFQHAPAAPPPPFLLTTPILTCTSYWCGARWPPSCGHGPAESDGTRDPPWSWPSLGTCSCHYSLVRCLLHLLHHPLRHYHHLLHLRRHRHRHPLLLHCFLQAAGRCEGHKAGPHCDSWGCARCRQRTPASWPWFPVPLISESWGDWAGWRPGRREPFQEVTQAVTSANCGYCLTPLPVVLLWQSSDAHTKGSDRAGQRFWLRAGGSRQESSL